MFLSNMFQFISFLNVPLDTPFFLLRESVKSRQTIFSQLKNSSTAPPFCSQMLNSFHLMPKLFLNSMLYPLVRPGLKHKPPSLLSAYLYTFFTTNLYILFPCVATLTRKLKGFLDRNLPHPRKNNKVATSDSHLGLAIARNLLVPVTSGVVIYDVMRGLRDKIDKFLHLDVCVPSSSYTHNPYMMLYMIPY